MYSGIFILIQWFSSLAFREQQFDLGGGLWKFEIGRQDAQNDGLRLKKKGRMVFWDIKFMAYVKKK